MLSCGMYDYSGSWGFKVGIPAKSGVAGAIMLVIPNVLGLCVWSPRLDSVGNSVRGVEFIEELVRRFAFHNYDALLDKPSPVYRCKDERLQKSRHYLVMYAAASGNVDALRRCKLNGEELGAVDYDGRSALHVAVSEGQIEVVRYLLSEKVPIETRDRWGGSPMEDAVKLKFSRIADLLDHAM